MVRKPVLVGRNDLVLHPQLGLTIKLNLWNKRKLFMAKFTGPKLGAVHSLARKPLLVRWVERSTTESQRVGPHLSMAGKLPK